MTKEKVVLLEGVEPYRAWHELNQKITASQRNQLNAAKLQLFLSVDSLRDRIRSLCLQHDVDIPDMVNDIHQCISLIPSLME